MVPQRRNQRTYFPLFFLWRSSRYPVLTIAKEADLLEMAWDHSIVMTVIPGEASCNPLPLHHHWN